MQPEAIIRGDLANVKTGRYCIISKEAVIRPPYKKFSKGWVIILECNLFLFNWILCFSVAFFPLTVGDNVYVGEKSIINAAVVGSYVYIGKNCVIVSYIASLKYMIHLTLQLIIIGS